MALGRCEAPAHSDLALKIKGSSGSVQCKHSTSKSQLLCNHHAVSNKST